MAYAVQDVTVTGEGQAAGTWDESIRQPKNWFNPVRGNEWQQMAAITRTPKGDLLMPVPIAKVGIVLTRSSDNGRTWSKPWSPASVKAQFTADLAALHATRDGRLIMQTVREAGRENKVLMCESTDDGQTWSDPATVPTGIFPADPENLWAYGPMVELRDRTMLRFLAGKHSSMGHNVLRWGDVHQQAFSIRSTDGGRTWSSRASIFTGFLPHQAGMPHLPNLSPETWTPEAGRMRVTKPVFTKALREAGYKAHYVGKWHLGEANIGEWFDAAAAHDADAAERSEWCKQRGLVDGRFLNKRDRNP